MRAAAIDERHVRAPRAAEPGAEPGRELEASCPASHHDDARAHQSSRFTSLPPRNRLDQRLLHLSHSSRAMAGSMSSYLNLLSGLSTARLEGTRLRALMISWPSAERMKSAKRSAACGCGARRATPTELGCPNAGCSGFHSIGAPLSFRRAIPCTCASTATAISPAATSSAMSVWPLRMLGFIAASFLKYASPLASPMLFATAANQATSAASFPTPPALFGCRRHRYASGNSRGACELCSQ